MWTTLIQYCIVVVWHYYKSIHRCHDFDDCFSSCTEEVTGLFGCEVKEDFRFNSSTTETSNPLRLAKLIMWAVPRLLPSQNAIRASESLAISALRIMPAVLPKALHLAGWSSTVSPCSLANLSPIVSAPWAWPDTMMTRCVLIFSWSMKRQCSLSNS